MDLRTFEKLIDTEKPVLIDFSAEWCGPCAMMEPILEEVKMEVGDRAIIEKIDVDESQRLAYEYAVQGVPTLMIFVKGIAKWRQSGVVPPAFIIGKLESFMTDAVELT